MVIIFVSQQWILPVHCQRILTQVVRSQTQEIYSSGKFTADHDCCRCFNHNSCFYVFIRNSFLVQSLNHFLNDRLDLIHFFFRSDHRIHQCQISIRTSSEYRTKLSLKHSFPVQTETDSTVSHDRIRFIRNVQIGSLFICSQICGTDHGKTVAHGFCNLFICQKQLILSRIILSSEVLKFTAQKSDSGCTVVKDAVQVIHVSDVRINLDPPAVLCHIRLFSQLQKFFSFFHIRLPANLIFFSHFFIRVDVQASCISVYDCLLPIPL